METTFKLIPWNELNSNGFSDIKVGDMIAWPTSNGPKKSEYFFSPVRRITIHGIYLMNRTIGFIKNGTDVKIKYS